VSTEAALQSFAKTATGSGGRNSDIVTVRKFEVRPWP
jgi:hypothetical protein